MGQWGIFDDEGDPVADFASVIEKMILPTRLRKLKTYSSGPCQPPRKGCTAMWDTKENIRNRKLQVQYIKEHPEKVWQAVRILCKKDPNNYQRDFMVVGIAIYFARGWHGTPLGGAGRLPRLPANFPSPMRKAALRAAQRELQEFDNHEEWKDVAERKKAMRKQIALFKI